MSTANITVNVSGGTVTVEEQPTPVSTDAAIRAAAKKRFEEEEKAARRAAEAALKQEKAKEDIIQTHVLEEQVRMRVQEEQIRRLAEKAVLEAEAKKLALAKEQAIAAEVERLRNRTKQEILEDTIADLKDQLASVKADRCKSCPHRA
jgi:DNA-binding helix-hairpin-helix protein with protein kinase domain